MASLSSSKAGYNKLQTHISPKLIRSSFEQTAEDQSVWHVTNECPLKIPPLAFWLALSILLRKNFGVMAPNKLQLYFMARNRAQHPRIEFIVKRW